MLLEEERECTLFSTQNSFLSKKLTFNYYSLNEELIPLNLKNIKTGSLKEVFYRFLPITNISQFDYGIMAGKMTNTREGLLLFKTILNTIIKINPMATILLKASPSSSINICTWMKEESLKKNNIKFMEGNESIELRILNDSFKYIISEMFSLSALAIETCKITKVVSIEKTIVNDYPSLKNALTERFHIKNYRKFAMNQLSFSESISDFFI
tara:strand:- start:94 stop:729 length:636 start_codon:yes stop_codon:yes gene_type:complete